MAETHPDLWNGDVALINDHEAVELVLTDGMLRRVIVCCDCGLAHLMSVDAESRKAYFVREDGLRAEEIRKRGRAAGHVFTLSDARGQARALAEALREGRRMVEVYAEHSTMCRYEDPPGRKFLCHEECGLLADETAFRAMAEAALAAFDGDAGEKERG